MKKGQEVITPEENLVQTEHELLDETYRRNLGASIPDTSKTGFYPTPSRVDPYTKFQPSFGDLLGANFRQETAIGQLYQQRISRAYDYEAAQEFDPLLYIPDDLTQYTDRFITSSSMDNLQERIKEVRQELDDKQMMAKRPFMSMVAGFPTQAIDPPNLFIPGTLIWGNTARGLSLLRGAVGTAASGLASGIAQETILQNTKLTREAEEAYLNPLTSALFAGMIGAGASAFKNKNYPRFQSDMVDEITDTPKRLTDNGTLTPDDIELVPQPLRKLMNITPMNRLFNSEFQTAKQMAPIFYEHNYNLVKNSAGLETDSAIETAIKADKRFASQKMLDAQDAYYEYRGIKKGPFRGTRDKISGEGISHEEFYNEHVWRVLVTNEESTLPEVNKAASHFREIFDNMYERSVKLGLLPDDITPKNAQAYFMSLYNKQKIIEEGGNQPSAPFFNKLLNEFTQVNDEIKAWKRSALYTDTQTNIKNLKEKMKGANKKEIDNLKEQINKLEENLLEATPARYKNSKGVLRSVKTPVMLKSSVTQTIDNILGHQEGALLNPVLNMVGSGAKPFKERTLLVNQLDLHDWQIRDPFKVADMYTRGVSPLVRMTEKARQAGYEDLSSWKAGIDEELKAEYDKKVKEAGKDAKRLAKLKDNFDKARSDIVNSIDLVKGVYGDGPNVLSGKAAQVYRNILAWNAIRLLGFMTITSFADMGNQVFRNGFYKSIHSGLLPVLRSISKDTIVKQDLKALGYGIQTELGSRLKSFMEHEGLTTNPSPFTKAFEAVEQAYGNATLMNQWNDLGQNIAGHVSINRTLDACSKLYETGKLSAKERKRLASLGINVEQAKIIGEKTKGQIDPDTGCRFADWTNWDIKNDAEAAALDAIKFATIKDIDSIILIPGLGDKPLAAQNILGKFILQFKSFLFTATNRVLFSGIQRRHDMEVWSGVASMLAMGALSYVTTSLIRGEEPDLSFGNLSQEAVDRSGVLGIFMEVYNIANKSGIIPGNTVSRYRSRDIAGALTGPTGGTLNETLGLISKLVGATAGGEQITAKDMQRFIRLIPGQNLFYAYQLNRAVAKNVALNLGLEDNTE